MPSRALEKISTPVLLQRAAKWLAESAPIVDLWVRKARGEAFMRRDGL